MSNQLVFIERDGGLLRRAASSTDEQLDALRFQSGCIAALSRFRNAGFRLILLINPSDSEALDASTHEAQKQAFVIDMLESQGVPFDAISACDHGADAGCDCAFPGIGLVADYIADAKLNRGTSIVAGDDDQSLALARAMGLTGYVISDTNPWADIAHAVLEQPRRASIERKTRETDICVDVDLDRSAEPTVSTGIGFFNHMLEQLGKHGGFELRITCKGDLDVDEHHTVEDVALALGQALNEALGDKRGIGRYGFLLPMDEAEATVAIDLSGRANAVFEGDFPRDAVGGLATELVPHFFRSLGDTLGAAIHIAVKGEDTHHMVEACFKGVARTLRQAITRSGDDLPSTKGTL